MLSYIYLTNNYYSQEYQEYMSAVIKDHTVTNRHRPIVEQGSLLFDMETKG